MTKQNNFLIFNIISYNIFFGIIIFILYFQIPNYLFVEEISYNLSLIDIIPWHVLRFVIYLFLMYYFIYYIPKSVNKIIYNYLFEKPQSLANKIIFIIISILNIYISINLMLIFFNILGYLAETL